MTSRVFSADLDVIAETFGERFARAISADERHRAEGLTTSLLRRRFVARRGLVRWILAGGSAERAAALEFARGAFGKPSIDGAHADAPKFTTSHRGARIAFAFSADREIGVDIERTDAATDAVAIARTYLAHDDYRRIAVADPDERGVAFARSWTRRESVLKADGRGIAELDLGPRAFERIAGAFFIGSFTLPGALVGSLAISRSTSTPSDGSRALAWHDACVAVASSLPSFEATDVRVG